MTANSFGSILKMHSFGESHGPALGVVIDGVPSGLDFDLELICSWLARRRPGQALTSQRKEEDRPELLSGVFEGKTLGTPIALLVKNRDARSEDYSAVIQNPRLGHADQVWKDKFGHVDPRGGGRSSGRETLARVMGGAIGYMLLKRLQPGFQIQAAVTRIGSHGMSKSEVDSFFDGAFSQARQGTGFMSASDSYVARFPYSDQSQVEQVLQRALEEGQSHGGTAAVRVRGLPAGLGAPVFHKLKADLASALFGIGATALLQIGDGDLEKLGQDFHRAGEAKTNYGGILGGITTGEEIHFSVGFKPTSSIMDVAKRGRHDPCIVPRALPVLEAMTCFVLADHLLWSRLDQV